MDKMMRPVGVTPMPSATIARSMAVYDELCPTVDDEVPVEDVLLQQRAEHAEWESLDAGWGHPARRTAGAT